MVPRLDLYASLDLAAQRRLTVVSAGPGWGKTSTLAGWASRVRRQDTIAWLSLESRDDSLTTFWNAALHALHRTGSIPPAHPLSLVEGTDVLTAEALQAMYQALVALPNQIVLVLDDFHVIQDHAVLESIELLLARELPLHFIVLTRSDPVLPLHRLRLSGDLSELMAEDLAFNRSELVAIAGATGLDLREDELDRVIDRTDGWPAGIRLAMLHLTRPGAARDLSDFGGSDRSVGEYFVAEVLGQQSSEVRDFLIRTSVADRVCAPLADAILPGGRSQAHLEALEQSNQFVTALGAERQWYHYHPLLREMLEHTLARDDPEEYRAAHVAAARWLAAHGEPLAALRHAVRAHDWELFTAVFVEGALLMVLGADRREIERLLAEVPYDQLEPTARLALCAWALSFLQGEFGAMQTHIVHARAGLAFTPEEARPATAAAVELAACAIARSQSDALTVIATTSAALTQLDHVSRPFPGLPGMRSVALSNLGVGLMWSGRTAEARDLFLGVVDRMEAAGLYLPAMNARGHLGVVEAAEGRFDIARLHAEKALESAELRGVATRYQLRSAYIARAFVDLVHADIDAADRSVVAGLVAVEGANEPAPTTAIYICQALVAVSRRRVRAARNALRSAEAVAAVWSTPAFLDDWHARATTECLLLEPSPSALADVLDHLNAIVEPSATHRVCRARLLLASGQHDRAEGIVRSVCAPDPDDDVVDVQTVVEAWLVRAVVADHQRRTHESIQSLRRALEFAGPQRLLRPFLVSGSERVPLLLRHLAQLEPASPALLRGLLANLGGIESPTREPEPLAESLTDRELAVLASLPSMQTNAEIAEGLFISVNTVKAHVKALYRKLGVNNRRDAIRRSRELGLLD